MTYSVFQNLLGISNCVFPFLFLPPDESAPKEVSRVSHVNIISATTV